MKNTETDNNILNILYEDKELIVCHKKAGIPVQSARLGQKDMVSILNNYLAEKGETPAINVVHRLDQPVEGVLVFAKTKRAAAELGKQIRQGTVKKIYRAVCCVQERGMLFPGAENPKEAMVYRLEDYLVKDGRTNTSSVCDRETKDAKRAELSFRVAGRAAVGEREYILADIELKTGRHHQIRVQMAHAGLPLYGDQKYNGQWQQFGIPDGKCESERDGINAQNGLALCAVSLTFRHPSSGKQMKFKTEPSSEIFRMF